MELFEEIKSNWKLDIYNKMQQIESLKNSYPAWTIKTFEGYGVAVLYNGDDVREDFSNAAIYCEQIDMNGENQKVLLWIPLSLICVSTLLIPETTENIERS